MTELTGFKAPSKKIMLKITPEECVATPTKNKSKPKPKPEPDPDAPISMHEVIQAIRRKDDEILKNVSDGKYKMASIIYKDTAAARKSEPIAGPTWEEMKRIMVRYQSYVADAFGRSNEDHDKILEIAELLNDWVLYEHPETKDLP